MFSCAARARRGPYLLPISSGVVRQPTGKQESLCLLLRRTPRPILPWRWVMPLGSGACRCGLAVGGPQSADHQFTVPKR
eukprot:gene113-biopygen9148